MNERMNVFPLRDLLKVMGNSCLPERNLSSLSQIPPKYLCCCTTPSAFLWTYKTILLLSLYTMKSSPSICFVTSSKGLVISPISVCLFLTFYSKIKKTYFDKEVGHNLGNNPLNFGADSDLRADRRALK